MYRKSHCTLLTASVLCLSSSAAWAAPPRTGPTAPAQVSSTESPAALPASERDATPRANEDAARYAEREASSPEAANFRGGDTLVIGATTATVVLGILLLVVLL